MQIKFTKISTNIVNNYHSILLILPVSSLLLYVEICIKSDLLDVIQKLFKL